MLAAFCQCAILGAGIYQAVAEVPNWRDPDSLAAHRHAIRHRHPGHFFRIGVQITLLLLVVALALSVVGDGDWGFVVVALASVLSAAVFSLVYFIPRNNALFFDPVEERPGERSRVLVRQWERANILRLLVQAPGVAASLVALTRLS